MTSPGPSGVWYAYRAIFFGTGAAIVRAYNASDPVPASVVDSYLSVAEAVYFVPTGSVGNVVPEGTDGDLWSATHWTPDPADSSLAALAGSISSVADADIYAVSVAA